MDSSGSQKIKVLYAITKGNFGGAQRYVFDLAINLPKDKFEAVVISGEGEVLGKKLEEAGIRTIRIESLGRDMRAKKDIDSFFQFLKILRTEKPDIIHLNSSKIGGLGGAAGRIYNLFFRPRKTKPAKIIFTGHGWAFNEERNWFSKKMISLAHFATIALSHRTIAVSGKTASDLEKFPFISNKKIALIYNGIGNFTLKTKEEARKILPEKFKDKIWFGTLSELHKNKGLDLAIESFSKISVSRDDLVFVIVGDGEEKNNLQKLVADKKMEEKVFLAGRIPNAAECLSAFDIFTLTSRTEAFPYALLEAGKAGLPVIASSVGGIPELVKPLETGILTRPNPKDIATAMKYVLENRERAAEFGANLKNKVEKDFTLEKMLKKTINLYG